MSLPVAYLWASEGLILSHGTNHSCSLILILSRFYSPGASLVHMLLTRRKSLHARRITAPSPSLHQRRRRSSSP